MTSATNFRLFTRDLLRCFARFYPLSMMRRDEILQLDALALVTIDPCESAATITRVNSEYSEFNCEGVAGRLVKLTRRSGCPQP